MTSNQSEEQVVYFLAQIGHELRTPLNAVQGFGTLLKSEAVGPLNDEQHKYLQKILDSSDHLLSIINQILDWAKLSTGEIKIEKRKIDLWLLLNEVAVLFELVAKEKNIQIATDVSKNLTIHGDHDRLRQVLINLTNNAIKFTPPHGCIKLSAYTENQDVCITVKDNGVGMSDETLERLFDAFYKRHELDNNEGAGLGLWISREIIHLHQGNIKVSSILGEGTSFFIFLPSNE